MSSENFYPSASEDLLRSVFVGKKLEEVDVPAAILDLAVVKQNCKLMLDAIAELHVSFRAHVKTHKTSQLTRMQIGDNCKDVRLVVSTIIELESLVGLLQDFQKAGATVNVFYGIPIAPSKVIRLAKVAKMLGPGTISAMIDNVAHLASVKHFMNEAGFPLLVFIKTDTGYHRAGISPYSTTMQDLVQEVLKAESAGHLNLLGFYSHSSLTYGGNSPDEAMDNLKHEIDFCRIASKHVSTNVKRAKPLIISVGASPQVLAIQNLQSSPYTSSAVALRESIDLTSSPGFDLELHAGVYSVFDLQQIAASSRAIESPLMSHKAIALTVLTEVVSVYPDRTSEPEALAAAGGLALGREPCKDYTGWGVITSWNMPVGYSAEAATNPNERMIIKRISQEHGILGWERPEKVDKLPLEYGQKLRIWPNHACITAAQYGWYLVVDSSKDDGDRVVDVWARWRGW